MSSLRDRIWAWLTAKPLTRIEIVMLVAVALFLQDVPKHPTLEILRWLILALLLFLVVLIGWIVWTRRGRQK